MSPLSSVRHNDLKNLCSAAALGASVCLVSAFRVAITLRKKVDVSFDRVVLVSLSCMLKCQLWSSHLHASVCSRRSKREVISLGAIGFFFQIQTLSEGGRQYRFSP
jgi:hypothetical protein